MRFSRRWSIIAVSVVSVALTLVLAIRPLSALDKIESLKSTLNLVVKLTLSDYKDKVDEARLWEGAIKGALETLNDPYSNWFPPADYTAFQSQLNGRFEGIGVFIDFKDHYLTVVRPIKGSPAEQAGLRTGDQITAADGFDLRDVPLEEAANHIRGPAGTTVHLRIYRPGEKRTFEVDVARAAITLPVIDSKMLTEKMGYIHLQQFTSGASSKFDEAVRTLTGEGASGLIIDLRGNPGGYLDQVVQIASRFVPQGQPVIWTVNRSGKTAMNAIPAVPIEMPTVFLVDNASASASEILAGAIQDYGVAPIVGIKTFGKGTVQEILTFSDGSGLKLTIDEYLTPKQHHVHGQGITPDVTVEAYKGSEERTKPLTWQRLLYRGVVGLDALYVQERLNDLGIADLREDGYFESTTMAAVEAFQRANGLLASGRVDEKTLEKLNARVAEHEAELAKEDLPLKKAQELLKAKLTAQATATEMIHS